MLEAAIKKTHPVTVAYLGMHGSYDQIPNGYKLLYHWLQSHHLQPEGAPSTAYYTLPGQTNEEEAIWELRAPVEMDAAEAEPDENGVGVRHIPPTTVAATVHEGPYETLEKTYADLVDWTVANGYVVVGPPEEAYLTGPDVASPEEHKTEIRFPVSRV